ncbi:MAG: hypothetical protein HN534_04460 [Euryarchaeota archaeon]|jgi:hypothetical protein|nr:hypothetical protein [Euryarchaeota archaeon]MBT3654163.1 hypothetical protein [Euryarchaeota archaeon]MBT3757079.1 hypothetical protein [Euryarchaeota archaeon]MBT4650469.1 hypothetical protein [Euryarchaeota archaeon]MBT4961500.1 hypothetical protein [Euryarchaeota archaeon]
MPSVSTTFVWSGSRSRAEALLAGISADDPESFDAKIIDVGNGTELRITVVGTSLKTVRMTMDDLLACLSAADSGLDAIDDS